MKWYFLSSCPYVSAASSTAVLRSTVKAQVPGVGNAFDRINVHGES